MRRAVTRWGFAAVSTLAGALSIFQFFNPFFRSHFDLVVSGLGDGRFCIAILDHWLRVFLGRAAMASPNFFYPERGVLGFSEALFLYAPPYALARLCGVDRYVAFELTVILVRAIGFASMLVLLRKYLGFERWSALLGAVLFTLSNLSFIQAGHAQLNSVAFVPLILCLACESLRAEEEGRRIAPGTYAALCGGLYALLFLTSFYIAWFAALFAGVLIPVWALVFRKASGSWRAIRDLKKLRLAAAWGLAAFAIGLAPFLVTYLPAFSGTGNRTMIDVLNYVPFWKDAINVGSDNLVWGTLMEHLAGAGNAGVRFEQTAGWPPATLAVFLVFGAVSVFGELTGKTAARRATLAALTLACVILLLADMKFGEAASGWWVIFHFVPGAGAIRATGRLNLVLNVAVVVVVVAALQWLWHRPGRVWAVLLGLFILTEQISVRNTHTISRREEAQRFAAVGPPPSSCRSFFAVKSRGGTPVVLQTDAMMVAARFGIPTVDGYSGWTPRDWNLDRDDSHTAKAASLWAAMKGISNGLCSLDLSSGAWSEAGAPGTFDRLGETVDFRTPAARPNTLSGWSGPEPGFGDWTVGPASELFFDFEKAPGRDLLLEVSVHAFLGPERPSFVTTVLANGRQVGAWEFEGGEDPVERRAFIPAGALSGHMLRIRFENSAPVSPHQMKMSGDDRPLSFAMVSLKISEAPGPR